jgi:3-hydroxyisobutyrate dehydrogenase-like beta-hydroxyacid dehydrogenase
MKVGFIGLGRMGSGMARRILSGGHELVVYDVARTAVDALVADGARGAASLRELCDGRDAVVTMLVEDAAVLSIATQPGGLCESLP